MKKTNINFKLEKPPRTPTEKYIYLKSENPNIEVLKKEFGLEIIL